MDANNNYSDEIYMGPINERNVAKVGLRLFKQRPLYWTVVFRALRRIHGPDRKQVGIIGKLHNEKLYNLYSSPNILV
jgi:hypothetical protein